MNSRKSYKKMLAKKARQRLTTKGAVLAAVGLMAVASAAPVLASTWKANTPESIQIKENDTSYTMVYGDTLWAISMKINVNVQTLAAINNINLAAGEEYNLAVGTVIRWDKSGNITAETPTGKKINTGVKANNSNKIVANKPIGTDVTADVKDNNISDDQINGKPDNVNTDKSNGAAKPGKDKDSDKGTNTPTDKDGLTIVELDDGESLVIGPFNSEKDAKDYFTDNGYYVGNVLNGGRDLTDYWADKFPNGIEDDKWYIHVENPNFVLPKGDPSTWTQITYRETSDGTHALVGPFDTNRIMRQYVAYYGFPTDGIDFVPGMTPFNAGIFDNPQLDEVWSNFPGGIKADKYYYYMNIEKKKPVVPTTPTKPSEPETKPSESTDSTESTDSKPAESTDSTDSTDSSESESTTETTEPSQPGTDSTGTTDSSQPDATTGTITIRYVNEYGEEISTPTAMSGPIGETFTVVAPSAIGEYVYNISELPAGALVSGDSLLFINEYTAEPQTITFSYYYEGE